MERRKFTREFKLEADGRNAAFLASSLLYDLNGESNVCGRHCSTGCSLRARGNEGELGDKNIFGGAPMPITIYGIKNCDAMKTARAWRDKAKVEYAFHGYKSEGIEKEKPRRADLQETAAQ